jgi:tetratricopeptide (TPR) repeat protein
MVAPIVPGATAPDDSPTARRVSEAFEAAYNLDHDRAVTLLKQAIENDPNHAGARRAIATVTWLNLLFKRGLVLVDHYLGPVSRSDVKTKPPPADVAQAFATHVSKAIAISEERVRRSPDDVNALYELGSAFGLQASYTATVEGRVMRAFGSARKAFDTQERVLALAPSRKDAGLIVGIYRYLVSNLILPARWVAYMAGFGGGREKGLQLIEDAARHPGDAQIDAKFALTLLWNREREYDRALAHLRDLQRRFPRNRLMWLESGSTLLRAGRAAEAEAELNEGVEKLKSDSRPRMAGEEGLWYYKRGSARVLLKRHADAVADLRHALEVDSQAWVRGRTHLELGKALDLAGNRAEAQAQYDRCASLCATANDPSAATLARRLHQNGYKG